MTIATPRNKISIVSLLLVTLGAVVPAPVAAQACGCPCAGQCTPSYRPACQVIYETQPISTCRLQSSLVYEKRLITTYQPTWETQMRECHYTVARPMTQTVQREERYTVLKPVWETQIRDRSYNVVKNIVETHEREERYNVSRPVCEMQQRAQTYQVRRYVTRTVEREVPRVSYAPVTSMRTSYVDQGRYVTQQVQRQGWSPSLLRWAPGEWGVDPATGKRRYQIPGLVWAKKPAPVRTVSRQVWQPNRVAVQVPQTSYQRVVTQVKVPSQVGEWVVENVVRQVPVRVCKTVVEQRVRKVPYTTTRQVVEKVERKEPVRICKYIREERVRKVPCTYTRTVYEKCVKQVPIRVCKMVACQKTILVPRCVQSLVPVERPCCVPRTVLIRVPNAPCCSQVAGITIKELTPMSNGAVPQPDYDGGLDETPQPVLPPSEAKVQQRAYDDGWRPRVS